MNRRFYRLAAKKLSGELKGKKEKKFSEWLQTETSAHREFVRLTKIWQSGRDNDTIELPDMEYEWTKLLAATRRNARPAGIKNSRLRPVWGITAGLAVALVCFYLFRNPVVTQNTSPGRQKNILFSDKSRTTLNSGTTLEYSRRFSGSERVVSLDGEAFFDISHDTRPFIVQTANAEIKVMGTKFNVWARDSVTRVLVYSGCVRLVGQNGEVQLTKGLESKVIGNSSPRQPVIRDILEQPGWMKGTLVFRQTSLNEITRELQRYYNKSVVLESDSLGKKTLTGVFENMKLDSVLSCICLTLDLNYTCQEDIYVISE